MGTYNEFSEPCEDPIEHTRRKLLRIEFVESCAGNFRSLLRVWMRFW